MAQHTAGDRDLVTLFTKALRALGKAGHADEAMRLGGQAWWALDATDPRAAERVNGTMHYLARLLENPQATDDAADDAADDDSGDTAAGTDAS